MSMPSRVRSSAPSSVDVAAVGLTLLAAGLLVARLWLPALGAAGRMAGLVAILLAVLVASLLVPVPRSVGRLHPAIVLGVGLAGVALVLVTVGRPVPTSYAAWAVPLALLAAVAEEALFRRTLYGALEPRGAAVAVVVSAVAFALLHVPLYGVAALPVDLGAGLLLSWQRWASGSWAAPATTHAAANLAITVLR